MRFSQRLSCRPRRCCCTRIHPYFLKPSVSIHFLNLSPLPCLRRSQFSLQHYRWLFPRPLKSFFSGVGCHSILHSHVCSSDHSKEQSSLEKSMFSEIFRWSIHGSRTGDRLISLVFWWNLCTVHHPCLFFACSVPNLHLLSSFLHPHTIQCNLCYRLLPLSSSLNTELRATLVSRTIFRVQIQFPHRTKIIPNVSSCQPVTDILHNPIFIIR